MEREMQFLLTYLLLLIASMLMSTRDETLPSKVADFVMKASAWGIFISALFWIWR
jgi:hypothetical protein